MDDNRAWEEYGQRTAAGVLGGGTASRQQRSVVCRPPSLPSAGDSRYCVDLGGVAFGEGGVRAADGAGGLSAVVPGARIALSGRGMHSMTGVMPRVVSDGASTGQWWC